MEARENSFKIVDQYEEKFEPPKAMGALAALTSGDPLAHERSWESISNETVLVSQPRFVEIIEDNKFVWDTRVVFAELFQYTGPTKGSLLTGMTYYDDEKLRKIEFKVVWSAKVGKDASFRSLELERIDFAEQGFETPSEEDLDRVHISYY